MDFIEIILKRRSIRQYEDKKVEPEKVKLLLEAAIAAPSACNFQPWEFIVVDDDDLLKKLRENLYAGPYSAPLAIVVCANMNFVKGGKGKHWVEDCSAATENILLVATSLGLGSCWIGVYPEPSIEKKVKPLLNIPNHVNVLNVIYIGYSKEEKESRTQYNEKVVYVNQYDPARKHRAREKNPKTIE